MQYPPVIGTDIVFEGTKTFWKTRVSIDLFLVYHAKANCIELIAHHPELGKECRIYLSSIGMLSKLDQNDLQQRLGEKKELFIKQKKPVNLQNLSKEVLYSSISNYVQSRLTYVSQEEMFSVNLQVLLGDSSVIDENDKSRLDIIIVPPPSLDPFEARFQRKISTKDIASAMNSLKASTEELRRATKYAELATSSVDGFKLMLAEKMKMEQEMRSKYSPARLRWIKAINRVLVQNYCDKVRQRLEMATSAEKPKLGASFSGQQKQRLRILRKSIDNSELESSKKADLNAPAIILPAITRAGFQSDLSTEVSEQVEKTSSQDSFLPSLKDSLSMRVSQRRRARLNKAGEAVLIGGLPATRLTRKSLNQDLLLQKYLPEIGKPSPGASFILSTPTTSKIQHSMPSSSLNSVSNSVPSLLQSYSAMSQKLTAPLPMSVIQGEFNKDSLNQKTAILSK